MSMTLADGTPAPRAIPFSAFFRREPLFTGAALLIAATALPLVLALFIDDRTLDGVPVWAKPLKFHAALTVYLLTLAWFAGWLPAGTTTTPWYRLFSALIVACIAAELIWIDGAAIFGIRSHFNQSEPAMASIYGLMGIVAVVLMTATVVYAALIAGNPDSPLDPAVRLAVVLGLGLTFLLTIIVTGSMVSGPGATVGGSATATGGVPLTGWSRDAGDLRVAHFFATHAMQVIPAFGLLAAWVLPQVFARIAIVVFSGAYCAGVAVTFLQAQAGQPFLAGLF